MTDELKDFIYKSKDKLMLFHLLTEDEVDQVLPYLEAALFKKGTSLFEEGEPGDFICFIVSGKLEVKKGTEFEGKQMVLGTLGKGSFVGEMSLINEGEPRSASVLAMEDTDVVILKRNAMDELTAQHPFIGVKLLKGLNQILAIRLRKAIERIAHVF